MHPIIQMVQPYWNGRSHSMVQVLHMKPTPYETDGSGAEAQRSSQVENERYSGRSLLVFIVACHSSLS
jgi:hypothetical protein